MRNLTEIDTYRMRTKEVLAQFGSYGDETCGAFMVPHPATGVRLKCVASSASPWSEWDHVSVSAPNRCPNWPEMQHIHRTFFRPDETAWEYHVRPADHVNIHPYTLHLWRKVGFEMPMPPTEFV